MTQRHRRLLAMVAVLALGAAGCSGTGRTYSAGRPAWGGLPSIQPGAPRLPGTSSGLQIQPGSQPTPTLLPPPTIRSGPALPDVSRQMIPRYPEATAARRRPPARSLPAITPQPQPEPGMPVATQPPGDRSPAALSGDIEIVPGPSIKAHRARLEVLPSPPGQQDESTVEILPTPPGLTVEEITSP